MEPIQQPQLLESAKHLDWLPDETVYSLASRHHRLSGNLRPDKTARQLFGHARGGYPHDLPAGLDNLAVAFGNRLGEGDHLALAHTVLPLFLAFRSKADRQLALTAMRSPRLGALKSRFGLLASGFGASCHLKACLDCVVSDRASLGTAYWHVQHQLPGVWMCAQHQQWLQVSISDRAKQGRFDWILPQEEDLRAIGRLSGTLPSQQMEFLARVNRMVLEAGTDAPAAQESKSTLTHGIWHGMVRNGWVSRSGQINGRAATTRLAWAHRQLALLPEWSAGPATEGACLSRIRKVLADPAQGHPLRALTVLTCLFESWGDFLDAVREVPEPVTAGKDAARAGKPGDDTRLELLAAAGGDASVSELAKRFGVAVSTAQAWLASEGWEPPKRPSKLYGPALSRAVEELTKGCHPSTVSAQLGLSESSVRRVLKTTVGLRTAWRKARHQLDENEARARWSAAISLAALSGPKTARTFEPGAYAWLYRNDRDWLLRTNALAKQPVIGNNRVVDWDSRDRLLSEACRTAATKLLGNGIGRRLTLTDLIRIVPELRTKIHRLECLPRTARVVRSVLLPQGSPEAPRLLTDTVED